MKTIYDDVYGTNLSDKAPKARVAARKFLADYFRNEVNTATNGAIKDPNKKLQTAMLFKQIILEQQSKAIGVSMPSIIGKIGGGGAAGWMLGQPVIGTLAGVAWSIEALGRSKAYQAYAIDALDSAANLFKSLGTKTDTNEIANAILGLAKEDPAKAAVLNQVIKNAPEKTMSGFQKYTEEALARFEANPTKVIDDIETAYKEELKKWKDGLSSVGKAEQNINYNKGDTSTHLGEVKVPNLNTNKPNLSIPNIASKTANMFKPESLKSQGAALKSDIGQIGSDIKAGAEKVVDTTVKTVKNATKKVRSLDPFADMRTQPSATTNIASTPKVEPKTNAFNNDLIDIKKYPEDTQVAVQEFKQKSKAKSKRTLTEKNGFSNPQAVVKGWAMRDAAILRKLRGESTKIEIANALKYLNSNHIGKPVMVDGTPAVVRGNSFGKVKVELTDGTVKNVAPENIISKKATDSDAIIYLQNEAKKQIK
jgi:hypothetical protein